MLRSRPVPACFKAAAAKSGDAYGVMWGPSEFSCTGNLRDWSVQERLHEINVPTLITCGRHDESTYKINLGLRRGDQKLKLENLRKERSHGPSGRAGSVHS
jgi:pimeloyl-ACP methyl ester carboxylesterase